MCPEARIGMVTTSDIQNLFRKIATLCPACRSWLDIARVS
jgi:hypothetical protein